MYAVAWFGIDSSFKARRNFARDLTTISKASSGWLICSEHPDSSISGSPEVLDTSLFRTLFRKLISDTRDILEDKVKD